MRFDSLGRSDGKCTFCLTDSEVMSSLYLLHLTSESDEFCRNGLKADFGKVNDPGLLPKKFLLL